MLDPETCGSLQVAVLGMKAVRNFIISFYEVGQQLLCMDDDVQELMELADGYRRSVRPLQDLQAFVTRAFAECSQKGLRLWGVYPLANYYFMR